MIPQVQNGDFTLRELEIIFLIQQGNSSQEIAERLEAMEKRIQPKLYIGL